MTGMLRGLAVAALLAGLTLPLLGAPAKAPQGPRVISTDPANGDKAVDPGLTTLRITFSEPMQANEYYIDRVPDPKRKAPKWVLDAPVQLSGDGLTFSIPVALQPGTQYGIVINPPGPKQFRSAKGKPATPYRLYFTTADRAAAGPTREAAPAPVAAAAPQGFRIISPTDASEVRDRVAVTVPASSVPEGGFVSFFVDGAFVVGMAPSKVSDTLKFEWDTKAPLPGTGAADKRIPKDGPHTIRAELHGGGQDQVSEVKVTLRNTINSAEAAEGLQLRYQFTPGQDLEYYQQFESRVKAPGVPLARHRGEIFSRLLVEEKLEEGPFSLVGRFGKALVDGIEYTGNDLSGKLGLGRSLRFELDEQGAMRITSKKGRPLVEVVSELMPLPNNRVKLNEPWDSTLILPEVLKGKMAVAPAKHVAEKVVWEGGQECVVIRSDFQVSGLKDPEPSKHLFLATGATSYPPGGTLTVRGRRYTFFAFRIGRVMRVSEQKTLRLILPSAPAMGISGMPGMPGMEGGMPGGMPGMPGMGMPGMGAPQQGASTRTVYDIEAVESLEFVPPGETEE